MKLVVLFIIWMALTLVLCLSIVGLLLFVPPQTTHYVRPTWMQIGYELLQKLKQES